MSQYNNDKGSSFKSFITGLAIGSALALIFAPYSGRKMRRVARQRGIQSLDDAKNKVNQFENETLRPSIEQVKSKGWDFWNKTKGTVEQTKQDAGDKIEEAGDKIAAKMKRSGEEIDESTEKTAARVKKS